MRATIVLGTSSGGVGTHIRSLVGRLPGLGIEVHVACPEQTEQQFGFGAAGAAYRPVPIGAAPRPRQDWSTVRALGAAVADSDVVHAHGLRAAALTGLAVGRRAPARTPLVSTWHNVLLAAGDGPEHNRLQQLIDADDLPVRLLGRRDDVPDLLAAADIYVLTSHWEARALVVQEAMAAGVPVVATAVGGIPELVSHGAVLVAAGDDVAIAREVGRLLDDAELRAELAGRGRLIAGSWPDEDETARRVAALYREVTNH